MESLESAPDAPTAVRPAVTEGGVARRRHSWRLVTIVYCLAWSALVTAYLLAPPLRPWLWTPIGLLGAGAVLLGVRLHRPSHALPWALVATALMTFVLGDTTYNVLVFGLDLEEAATSPADFFYLLTYPAFAGALVVFNRRAVPYRDGAVLLDSLIVSAGVGLLAYVYWVGTFVSTDEELGTKLVLIAYPVGDVLLLAMLARLLLSVRSRPVSLVLLTSGTASLLVVDVIYGIVQVGSPWSNGSPVDVVWFIVYGLWGAAALHPSMRELTEPQSFAQSEMPRSRLVIIGAASLIAPFVLLERSLERQALETGVIAVFSTLLFGLVLARLTGVLRQQKRSVERERALRWVSGDLARATTRAGVKAVVERTMPSIADSTMTSWLVLREELGAATGEVRRSVDAYGRAPRGRVLLPRLLTSPDSEADGSLVLMIPVAASDEAELLGVIGVAGPRVALESVGDAFETLTSQIALCRHDTILYIDDAHGFGVIGEMPSPTMPYGLRGNSIVRYAGETYDNVVLVGGFSKAYSSLLAFLALPTHLKNHLKVAAAPYLYSGPSPTASLATVLAGFDVNEARGDRIRLSLAKKTRSVLQNVHELGLRTPNITGFPVIEIPLAHADDLPAVGDFLFDQGIYVTLAAYPLVPRDQVGFRIQVTAANQDDEIDELNHALKCLTGRFELQRAV